MRRFLKFLVCLALPLLTGYIGSLMTSPAIDGWYVAIAKPFFTPPNWLFAPVWTLLFILMGLALFYVADVKQNQATERAIFIFAIQLCLNLAWSFFFFSWQELGYAFAEIIVLWLMILINTIMFYNIKKMAGYLLVPYLLWVSFAVILNFNIWLIN